MRTIERSPTATAGLDIQGDGRGCNQVAARFTIDEATFDASGNVLTFAARFETHCVAPRTCHVWVHL